MATSTEIEINGKKYSVNYPPDTPLLYVLRDELGLSFSIIGLTFCVPLARLGDELATMRGGSAAVAMATPANSKRSRRVSDRVALSALTSRSAASLMMILLLGQFLQGHS